MLVAHGDACSAILALGACLRRIPIRHPAKPAAFSGWPAQSALALAVATFTFAGSGEPICRKYPHRSGSRCTSTVSLPIVCARNRTSS